MPRPPKIRRVFKQPPVSVFKPVGVPLVELEKVELTVDEFEAMRLAHLEGFYQVAIARHMNVSRPTVGRILDSAHRKVTEALVEGKALQIEGGVYDQLQYEPSRCPRCGNRRRHGRQRLPEDCPRCETDEETSDGRNNV